MIKTIAPNDSGRDFVIGDLHGAFDLLDRFMTFSNFDTRADRIFSVGDLIDRGPKNLECLRLLKEPWFHAVMGNHESMMIDTIFDSSPISQQSWALNGGSWFNKLENQSDIDEAISLVNLVHPWPLCVEVPGQFRVIHAELSEAVAEEDFHKDFSSIAIDITGFGDPPVTWGRKIFGGMYASQLNPEKIKRISKNTHKCGDLPIFCGHTVIQQPTKLGNFINIDTGAVFIGSRPWTGLTVAEPLTGKFWKVTDDINEIELMQ